MFTVISRYLAPYLGSVLITGVMWVLAINMFNGAFVTLTFALFLGAIVFGVPILLYRDYRNLKRFVSEFVDGTRDREKARDLIGGLAQTSAERFGIPNFIASFVVEHVSKRIGVRA